LLTPPTFVKSLWTVPLAAGSINYDSRAGSNAKIKPRNTCYASDSNFVQMQGNV